MDSTCVDSFSPSALALTANEPGSASRSTEVHKNLKYEGLCDRYIFQAIAIESCGVFGRDTNASFPDWVTRPHQSAVNVAKLNFSTNDCHLQQSIRMEVASSRPDYLPTLSVAKTSKLSLLVKHHILAIEEASKQKQHNLQQSVETPNL